MGNISNFNVARGIFTTLTLIDNGIAGTDKRTGKSIDFSDDVHPLG